MARSQTHDTEGGEALLTVEEAIEALNVSRRTFYRWLKAGRIHTIKVGRRRMVPLSEVERLKKESLLPAPRRPPRRPSVLARLDEIASLLAEMRKREEEAERREETREKRLEILAEEIRALREEFAEERKIRRWLIGLLLVVLAALAALIFFILWRV